jgi:hypothetical protein
VQRSLVQGKCSQRPRVHWGPWLWMVGFHRLGRYGTLQVLQLQSAMIGGMLRGKECSPGGMGGSRSGQFALFCRPQRCNVMHGSLSDKSFSKQLSFPSGRFFTCCNMMDGIRSTRALREFPQQPIPLLGCYVPCIPSSNSCVFSLTLALSFAILCALFVCWLAKFA